MNEREGSGTGGSQSEEREAGQVARGTGGSRGKLDRRLESKSGKRDSWLAGERDPVGTYAI